MSIDHSTASKATARLLSCTGVIFIDESGEERAVRLCRSSSAAGN
jgi:hypothetical protein